MSEYVLACEKAAGADANWDDVMMPTSIAGNKLSRVWSVIAHIHSVKSTSEWRKVYNESLTKYLDVSSEIAQHTKLYKKYIELYEKKDELNPTRQRILEKCIWGFEMNGVGLSDEKRDKFRSLVKKLCEIGTLFGNNILDATNKKTISASESELGEMPSDIKKIFKSDDGNYVFTLNYNSYSSFMKYCTNREKRQQFHYDNATLASELGDKENDNSALIDEMLKINSELAGLLNFTNYADYAMQKTMAKNPGVVKDFLRDISSKAMPIAKKEMNELKKYAKKKLGIDDIKPWDFSYVSNKLLKEKHNFSQAELRPYFKLNNVLSGFLSLTEKLYNIKFEQKDVQVYDPDVKFLSVTDNSTGELIGGIYFDFYAHKDKNQGAWMSSSVRRFIQSDKKQYPLINIVCNYNKDKGDGEELMDLNSITTLFHELGHGLHALLNNMDEYALSTIGSVEQDAIEIPSQFMENYIWHWPLFKSMSSHVDTGKKIPKKLYEGAKKSSQFQSCIGLMGDVRLGLFDMTLYSESPRPFMEVMNEIRKETSLMESPKYDRLPCSFSHIFNGGYSAGYYGYLWADVLASDLFSKFKKSGDVTNPKLGAELRDKFLSLAGSRDSMDSFIEIMGRKPDPSVLLSRYGLSNDGKKVKKVKKSSNEGNSL